MQIEQVTKIISDHAEWILKLPGVWHAGVGYDPALSGHNLKVFCKPGSLNSSIQNIFYQRLPGVQIIWHEQAEPPRASTVIAPPKRTIDLAAAVKQKEAELQAAKMAYEEVTETETKKPRAKKSAAKKPAVKKAKKNVKSC